jgi:hypothetical protein
MVALGQGYQTAASGESVTEYLDFISQVNHFSPSEGAGSQGSYGLKVGVGMQVTPRNYETPVGSSQLYLVKKKESQEDIFAPRISIIRGLFIPVNFGVSFGVLDDTSIQQWAGFIQWTVFELKSWPAIATRYSISKITGIDKAELTSQSVEAVLSYGFLRYFNVYVSSKMLRHDVVMHSSSSTKQDSWTNYSQGGGIEIMILPPFTAISAEVQKTDAEYLSYYTKLSYLL